MSYHVCVWIDQRQAKVFEVASGEADQLTPGNPRPLHHLHRRDEHVGLNVIEMDRSLLEAVGRSLVQAKALLIVGPGKAKTVLAGYLNEHFPEVARRIWDIRPSDHSTDAEVVAAAREYFRSADRIRSKVG